MQNMLHVCGGDYFHAPVIISVPLTPKIILLQVGTYGRSKTIEGVCGIRP